GLGGHRTDALAVVVAVAQLANRALALQLAASPEEELACDPIDEIGVGAARAEHGVTGAASVALKRYPTTAAVDCEEELESLKHSHRVSHYETAGEGVKRNFTL